VLLRSIIATRRTIFYGIHVFNSGRVMIFAGGMPLKRDGKVVGVIGVSGGSGGEDREVAEAPQCSSKTLKEGEPVQRSSRVILSLIGNFVADR